MEYWSEVREIEASKLILIDESGVNLALLRLYARALIDRRTRGRNPQKRGRNISIISAISLEKVVASVNIYGAVDAVTFEGFIAFLIQKRYISDPEQLNRQRFKCAAQMREPLYSKGSAAKN